MAEAICGIKGRWLEQVHILWNWFYWKEPIGYEEGRRWVSLLGLGASEMWWEGAVYLSCCPGRFFLPSCLSYFLTQEADLYGFYQYIPVPSGFWLDLINGKSQQEIRGEEGSEVMVSVLLTPSCGCLTLAVFLSRRSLFCSKWCLVMGLYARIRT